MAWFCSGFQEGVAFFHSDQLTRFSDMVVDIADEHVVMVTPGFKTFKGQEVVRSPSKITPYDDQDDAV